MRKAQLPKDKSFVQKTPLLDPRTRSQGHCDQIPRGVRAFVPAPLTLANLLCHRSQPAEMNWQKVDTSILGASLPTPDLLPMQYLISFWRKEKALQGKDYHPQLRGEDLEAVG